jgi:CDP-L-myo-inositol myo-inositolphosphotransferase
MSRQIRQGKGLRMGRDVRVFIIFLGAVLHIPFWSLLLIAVMMNLETLRRIIVCRNYE